MSKTSNRSRMRHVYLVASSFAFGPPIALQAQAYHDELPPLTREQLALVEQAAARVSTPENARRWGYQRIAPRSITDLNHLTGEHWINERYLRTDSLDPTRPAYLMFYPVVGPNAELQLVGVAFGMAQLSGADAPEGFAGSSDVWHVHHACRGVPGLKSILAKDATDCRSLGGTPGTAQISMLHVWLNPSNPAGPFAPDNPALPFVAIGLTPPSAQALSDPTTARRVRTLGLALGERLGAVPRLGGLIDSPRNPDFAARVAPHRDRIRVLVPLLREAQARNDEKKFEELTDRAIAEWEIIRQAYLDAADSDALRTLIARWFEQSITGSHRARH